MFRAITTDFWLDAKVEGLSSTAKYLLLYLFTNPRTNLAGCYEITNRRVAVDMGLSTTQVEKGLAELCEANVVCHCAETSEVLIRNWDRYNWTRSKKLVKPLAHDIGLIKCKEFREYLAKKMSSIFPDEYRIDTVSEKDDTVPIPLCTVSVPVTGTDKGVGVQGEGGRRFSKPTLEDVTEYAASKGYEIDAQHFIDYYESNGWKVGRNPMKDWKASVRNWARNDFRGKPKGGAANEDWKKYDRIWDKQGA